MADHDDAPDLTFVELDDLLSDAPQAQPKRRGLEFTIAIDGPEASFDALTARSREATEAIGQYNRTMTDWIMQRLYVPKSGGG